MRPRPRILLDVDGPCADFVIPALDAIFEITGRRFKASDHVSGWDIFSGLGLTEDETKRVLRAMEVPGLCLGIPMVAGAADGIEELRSFAEVWAVTSPFGGEHWMHERDAWLVRHMGFHKDQVLHVRSSSKHGVYGNMLVEDKVDTLEGWSAAWPKETALLFELPYNKGSGWNGAAVDDWSSLVSWAATWFTGDWPKASKRCPARDHHRHVGIVCSLACCTTCGGSIDADGGCRCE